MIRTLRQYDFVILIVALGLVGYGAVLLYSASLATYPEGIGGLDHPVARHVFFGGLGLVLALSLVWLDYRFFGQVAPSLYLLSILLLVLVLFVGVSEYGSSRWVSIAGTPVQPSEIAKVFTIIALAKFLADRRAELHRVRTFLASLGIAVVPMLLVMLEPDLGTAVIFGAVWLGMVVAAGARPRHLLVLSTLLLVAVPFFAMAVMGDYQRERLALFFNPNQDPLGGGFNILQAEIGIGSGGLLGSGLTEGSQTQLDFLQTTTTDYIFSVLGEELGFVGAMVLFTLFIVLLFQGIRTASMSTDMFGRLMATGIVIMILAQVFINVAVNVRLLPVTGIPLPFISRGGSSLLSLFLAVGLLQVVRVRQMRSESSYSFRSY